MASLRFPEGFHWGAATSAYQIEGAAAEDGKGPSIWDVFCREPGRIWNGETGAVACDHYHRWATDVALMAELGLPGYRFSIAWPRIQPSGAGPANPAGLAFYDRLVDALLAAGIAPCATLYHWDLPQALQDQGGWASRDTAARFADYAALCYARLGDRVERWITHNEPLITVVYGHVLGVLAPGIRDLATAGRVLHHVLLSHGLAVQAFRASGRAGAIGIANADRSLEPADDRPETAAATERARDFELRAYHDPLFGRGYPASVLAYFAAHGAPLPIRDGDLATIAAPIDFVGANVYTRARIVADPGSATGWTEAPPTLPLTEMGYEQAPEALGAVVRFLDAEYGRPPIWVTENGVCDNTPPVDGAVDDRLRIELLRGFLASLARAIADGADVRAYYLWSLLDNFEWAYGTSKRFGIVWTDFATQARLPKASARFYAEVIRWGGVEV